MSIQLNALWNQYGRLSPDEIPAEASLAARQCVLDWFGCTLAGSTEPLAQMLRAEFEAETGTATIIAALINRSAWHSLDVDDTNLVGGFHATTVVLPAALALAEQLGASGAD